MALNIKDPETERLATEVAALTGESKTRAIRQALSERKQRLLLARNGRGRYERTMRFLEGTLWAQLPDSVRGVAVTKEEREALLGYGPDGV